MGMDRPKRRSPAWMIASVPLLLIALVPAVIGYDGPGSAILVLLIALAAVAGVVAWAVSRTRRDRQRYEEELSAWAAERAAQAERLRIAADLHDLVSHGLGAITVRAAVARRIAEREGVPSTDDYLRMLIEVEEAGRETTRELRRMLGVLRSPGSAPLRPAEGIDDLPMIIRTAERSGLSVTFAANDTSTASPGAQLVACSVVREALANVLRYAGPADAEVALGRESDALVVAVSDSGPQDGWIAQPGSGHGLAALRERVEALGGRLDAQHGRRGFRVLARIPEESIT